MSELDRADVLEAVVASIHEVLPDLAGRQIEPTDRLVDLGANSVDRAEITMLAMEALSIEVERTRLAGVKDIGGLVDTLHANARGR
ncbi:acyl carrier protein [Actinokineospora sp. PR83]|uniref:acyl carrier protein n=1 Tax=Actinokineospora sp. PR83 TaxID=2884908 RepID=UPI001F389950|nr:acyl carrier protein [Actinokineospora sp. PR83]MCG8915253.1 acyl carrier protein [Actinokineospora sp. PR83]